MFRCHPKERDGRKYLVAVNDITFNPSYVVLLLSDSYLDLLKHVFSKKEKGRILILFGASGFMVFSSVETMRAKLQYGML